VKSGAWGIGGKAFRLDDVRAVQAKPGQTAPVDPMFADQTVLLTGSGQGIGKTIARRFAQGGARVQLVARVTRLRNVPRLSCIQQRWQLAPLSLRPPKGTRSQPYR
jgi:short subunit dehydrogenase